MKIVTWNVNSIRPQGQWLLGWLARNDWTMPG